MEEAETFFSTGDVVRLGDIGFFLVFAAWIASMILLINARHEIRELKGEVNIGRLQISEQFRGGGLE